jgi:hypothetical protein
MARKKRAGRPKGSKNKSKMTSVMDLLETTPKRRGRPAGKNGKRSPGRPAGIAAKRRGRPAGTKNNIHSLLTPGSIQGIHFIGKTLIVDTNEMDLNEVIFLGEGKQPKVR